jgi:hypothetical protein
MNRLSKTDRRWGKGGRTIHPPSVRAAATYAPVARDAASLQTELKLKPLELKLVFLELVFPLFL